MKFGSVTIKDIAGALGLSTSTVSRALRDSHEISPETKRLVLEYAEKINYHPNPVALSLKEGRTRSIGIIVSEIANSFFSQVINGVEIIANQKGYNTTISQSHESAALELMNLQYLTSRSVDGLILSVSSEYSEFSFLKELHAKGMPIVFFDRVVEEINTHKVIVDNFKGAYDATTHLIYNGYRRIASLNSSSILSITRERLAGYKAALIDQGIEPVDDLIKYCQHGGMIHEEVESAVNSLLQMENRPDAILTAADKLTTGCFRILLSRGVKIPQDIALIGFSNSDLTDMLAPSLSVIRQPSFEMGEAAISLLLQLIENKNQSQTFEIRMMAPELFLRESSMKRS